MSYRFSVRIIDTMCRKSGVDPLIDLASYLHTWNRFILDFYFIANGLWWATCLKSGTVTPIPMAFAILPSQSPKI